MNMTVIYVNVEKKKFEAGSEEEVLQQEANQKLEEVPLTSGTKFRFYASEKFVSHETAVVTKSGKVFSVHERVFFDTLVAWKDSLVDLKDWQLPNGRRGNIYVNGYSHFDVKTRVEDAYVKYYLKEDEITTTYNTNIAIYDDDRHMMLHFITERDKLMDKNKKWLSIALDRLVGIAHKLELRSCPCTSCTLIGYKKK